MQLSSPDLTTLEILDVDHIIMPLSCQTRLTGTLLAPLESKFFDQNPLAALEYLETLAS